MSNPKTPLIRVLIVDDSAYIRKSLRKMLLRSPFIDVVGIAHDGTEALELVERLRPDVVTLDLNMPLMGGLEFLAVQMARRPLPVVVVSIASTDSQQVLAALEAGAVDFVHKPTALANATILEIGQDMIAKVKAAAQVVFPSAIAPLPPLRVLEPHPRQPHSPDIIVLGISTGGPQALNALIPQLPANFPVPIAIVLHMPVGYTALYAARLNQQAALTVVEATAGMPLTPGTVYLAPAGKHLRFQRQTDGTVITQLALHPFDQLHRPAVDVLFQSAAAVFGDRTVGIVMTGMGSDGKQGAAWIKSQGGRIFTEAPESCVIYGMPRSVVEAGLSDGAIPLPALAAHLCRLV
jgi:two-component system chemotaxis response regulator CheB